MYSIGLETKCVCLFVCVRMRHLCTDESSILYAFRVKISFNIARIQVSFAHFILLCFMHTVFSCLCSNEEKKTRHKQQRQQQHQPIVVTPHSKRNDSYLEYHSQLNVSLSTMCTMCACSSGSKTVFSGK